MGLDGGFIAGCWKNIVEEIQIDAIEEQRLQVMFHRLARCLPTWKSRGIP